jgi:hypothetical protein
MIGIKLDATILWTRLACAQGPHYRVYGEPVHILTVLYTRTAQHLAMQYILNQIINMLGCTPLFEPPLVVVLVAP